MSTRFISLIEEVKACTLCQPYFEHSVRPVLQVHPKARILIAGQAPGRKVHASGIPFDDASGDRLRSWLGVDRATFYDETKIAILPMGFCYPGTGPSGDLPPRPECAAAWRANILSNLSKIQLTLVIGQYAQAYHLGTGKAGVTDTVAAWREYWPQQLPLPHPSPRNNIWLRRNPWFEEAVLPELKSRVASVLNT